MLEKMDAKEAADVVAAAEAEAVAGDDDDAACCGGLHQGKMFIKPKYALTGIAFKLK